MQTQIKSHLEQFTRREDALIARLRFINQTELPERLSNWRLWIQDSAIYLSELRNLVEDREAQHAKEVEEIGAYHGEEIL